VEVVEYCGLESFLVHKIFVLEAMLLKMFWAKNKTLPLCFKIQQTCLVNSMLFVLCSAFWWVMTVFWTFKPFPILCCRQALIRKNFKSNLRQGMNMHITLECVCILMTFIAWQDAAKVIQGMIEKNPGSLNFNVIAISKRA
jgi:hypothetical protein